MASSSVAKPATHKIVCQVCGNFLEQDSSLENIDEQTFKKIETSTNTYDEPYSESQNGLGDGSTVIKKTFVRKRASQSSLDSLNSFYFLQSGVNKDPEEKTMSEHRQEMQINEKIYDFLSEQCAFDHPLCQECSESLLDKLDTDLLMSTKELASYKNLLEQLDEKNVNHDENFELLRKELLELDETEVKLKDQLYKLERENEELSKEAEELEKEEQTLQSKEVELLREYNEQKRLLFEAEDEQKSIDNQIKNAMSQHGKLSKTNAFNAAFHIWHQEDFVTINGFRLGSLPQNQVDRSEINAGLGQAALLLNSLAKRIDLQFSKYRIVPMGSHSYIEDTSKRENGKYVQLPLYMTQRLFSWNHQFDEALIAFLNCVNQFKTAIETKTHRFCLPYKIHDQKEGYIVDSSGKQFSVKWQGNSLEEWTKALKCVLTNLKWGLTWVSSKLPDDMTTSNMMSTPSSVTSTPPR